MHGRVLPAPRIVESSDFKISHSHEQFCGVCFEPLAGMTFGTQFSAKMTMHFVNNWMKSVRVISY